MGKTKSTNGGGTSQQTAEPGTAIAVAQNYAIFSPDADIQTVIRENMGGELKPSDLERVKMPSGGVTQWIVPTIEGTTMQETIEGVIIFWRDGRAYWQGNTPAAGQRPDCRSDDMVRGQGTPGGECDKCPLNEWGSAKGSDGRSRKGKACKERSWLYVMCENDLLPRLIALAPASLKAWRQYRSRLTTNAIPYYSVVTKIGLKPAKSEDGIAYAEATFAFGGRLSKEQMAKIMVLAQMARGGHEKAPPEPAAGDLSDDVVVDAGSGSPTQPA